MITVSGNAYLLKTAFVNLMENNCKFSDDKTSSVQISFYEENPSSAFPIQALESPQRTWNISLPLFTVAVTVTMLLAME